MRRQIEHVIRYTVNGSPKADTVHATNDEEAIEAWERHIVDAYGGEDVNIEFISIREVE